ncbi:hypothetical protein TNCV_5097511 [Trichonephila clavipes]|nr:hypothetical protein TNCV_5097511 [Trichonephila clavipes]
MKDILITRPSGQGIGSWLTCHEFEPSTTKEPPCREAMYVEAVESSNVILLPWLELIVADCTRVGGVGNHLKRYPHPLMRLNIMPPVAISLLSADLRRIDLAPSSLFKASFACSIRFKSDDHTDQSIMKFSSLYGRSTAEEVLWECALPFTKLKSGPRNRLGFAPWLVMVGVEIGGRNQWDSWRMTSDEWL